MAFSGKQKGTWCVSGPSKVLANLEDTESHVPKHKGRMSALSRFFLKRIASFSTDAVAILSEACYDFVSLDCCAVLLLVENINFQ